MVKPCGIAEPHPGSQACLLCTKKVVPERHEHVRMSETTRREGTRKTVPWARGRAVYTARLFGDSIVEVGSQHIVAAFGRASRSAQRSDTNRTPLSRHACTIQTIPPDGS